MAEYSPWNLWWMFAAGWFARSLFGWDWEHKPSGGPFVIGLVLFGVSFWLGVR